MLASDMETNAAPSPEQRTRSAASNAALIIADFCAYLKSVTVRLRTEEHTHFHHFHSWEQLLLLY